MRGFCLVPGLFFFTFLFGLSANAQNLSLDNQSQQVTIHEFSGTGYRTIIDFDYKSVKKDFWRFCNEFAKLENMRKYYEVIIPPSSEDANSSTNIWVEIKALKNGTQMKALLNPGEMDESTRQKNESAADKLLREFKIFFYQKWIQDSLEILEKENRKFSRKEQKLSQKIERAKDKGKSNLSTLESTKREVSTQLAQGLTKVESLKDKLKEIK